MNNIGITLTADNKAMIRALQDAEKAMASMGKDMSDALKQVQAQANQTGQAMAGMANPSTLRGMAQLNKQVGEVGMSAKATAAALRQVPAQFTDIVVSLQGGQAPLTVLLQQGGQLKDVFGGIGPAARALGGYVLGLVNPVTLVAAAVLSLGIAFRSGLQEMQAYRSAIASTGNSAGVTVNQLAGMAASMDEVSGQTKGQAAEALTAMVATGRVARASMQDYAQTAITASKVFGQAIEDTAKNFGDLGKDPVGASKRLNESLNYLTAATYEQIVAAKALGQDQKAAALAQEAYAKGEASRAAMATQNLGYLEKAWKAVTGAVIGTWNMMRETWDWFKSLGREDAVSVQIAAARKELDLIDKGLRNVSPRQKAALEQQLAALQETEKIAKLAGDKQAERVAAEKAGIVAVDAAAEAAKKNREAREAAAKKSAEEAMRMIEDGVKLQQSLTAQDSGLSPEFAKQWDNLGKAYKANKISLEQLLEAQKLLLDQQPFVKKAAKDREDAAKEMEAAAKREADGLKITNQLREESLKPYEQSLKAQQKRVDALEQEEAALAIAEKMNISLAQAVEVVNIARLEEQKTAARAAENFEAVEMLQREIEEREKLVKLIGSKEARDASAKAAKQAATDWERASNKIQDSITDALLRGFESGKGFAENLRDTVKNMFSTMVLRPIIQAVVGGVTGLGGASAMAGGGSGGGVINSLSQLRSMYSAGTTGAMNFLTGGTINSAAAGMWTRAGDWMSTSSSNAAANAGSWMQANPQVGAYLGMAGNAVAGYGISKSLSGGYQVGDKDYVSAIAGIASAFAGPIAGVVGAVVNRAFGRKAAEVTGEGIRGTFSGSGADVQSYQDLFSKGGYFRSDRRETRMAAVSSEVDQMLDQSIAAISTANRGYAQALGLSANSVNGYSEAINISLKGLDAAGQEKAIAEALAKFGEGMAQQVLGAAGSGLVRAGETSAQALQRLGTSLQAVNGVLGTLNQSLLATSLAGADAASQLIDLFGGAQAFAQSTAAYYQAYYSEAERSAKTTEQITAAMNALGLAMPSTLAGFRALVEAQDLTTEAGRQTYAQLINLAPAFTQVAAAIEQAAAASSQAAQAAADAAAAAIQKIKDQVAEVQSEAEALLDQQISTSQSAAAAARAAADAFDAAGQGLREAASAILMQLGDVARNTRTAYTQGLSLAQTGNVDALRALPGLATAMLTEQRSRATTSVEAALFAARTAAELANAAKVAGTAAAGKNYEAAILDVNTATLQVMRDQLQAGTATSDSLRQQLAALKAIEKMLGTVGDAQTLAIQQVNGSVTGTGEAQALALRLLNKTTTDGVEIQDSALSVGEVAAVASIGSESLLDAVLSQLKVPDASANLLNSTITAGNSAIVLKIESLIGAVQNQSAAQQAEAERARALAAAMEQLKGLATGSQKSEIDAAATNSAQSVAYARAALSIAEYDHATFGYSSFFKGRVDSAKRSLEESLARELVVAQQKAAYEAQVQALRQTIISLGGVPAFATGGIHSGGIRLVGENGPELEVTGASRIYNAQQTAAMLQGGGDTASEMRAMREELAMLRAEARATAINTGRQADLMKRVTRNGEAMTVMTDIEPLEVTTS